MDETHLNLDDFPSSPYAAELLRGVSVRTFAPDIEAQFRRVHLVRVQLRARLWFTVSALAAVIYSVLALGTQGLTLANGIGTAILLVPASVILFIVWSPYYHRWFLQAANIAVPITQTVLVINLAEAMASGRVTAVGALVLSSFAVFFFSGLLFPFALLSGLGMLLVYGIAAQAYGLPPGLLYPSLATTGLAVLLAALVSRGTEIAYRTGFLESVLVRDLAARDGLTGVMNRRAFDEHLHRIWQQALRDKRHIGLIIIDIDHFKAYNDRHGHQAGDSTLRVVAQTIMGFARRPFDMAARYGGEEFAIVLYDLTQEQLEKIAEQLRSAVAGLQVDHGAALGATHLTVSVGVGRVQPAIDRTPQGAVQLADEALYEAKARGRNRVVVRGAEDYGSLNTGSFTAPRNSRG